MSWRVPHVPPLGTWVLGCFGPASKFRSPNHLQLVARVRFELTTFGPRIPRRMRDSPKQRQPDSWACFRTKTKRPGACARPAKHQLVAGARYVPNTQFLNIPFRSELFHFAA